MSNHDTTAAILQCSPRATTLLKFLVAKANNVTHSSFWRVSKIIAACGFSRATYHRAIRELTKAGFVTVKERTERCGRQMSNEYILNMEILSYKAEGQKTAAPAIKSSSSVRLTGMAYKIYLYLQVKCGRKGYRVGRKEIASACGVTPTTVGRYIRFLEAKGYICCREEKRADGGRGYNLYAIAIPRRSRILRFMIAVSLLVDTLPLYTDDTPLTLSKFELDNSKDKKRIKVLVKKLYVLNHKVSQTFFTRTEKRKWTHWHCKKRE